MTFLIEANANKCVFIVLYIRVLMYSLSPSLDVLRDHLFHMLAMLELKSKIVYVVNNNEGIVIKYYIDSHII